MCVCVCAEGWISLKKDNLCWRWDFRGKANVCVLRVGSHWGKANVCVLRVGSHWRRAICAGGGTLGGKANECVLGVGSNLGKANVCWRWDLSSKGQCVCSKDRILLGKGQCVLEVGYQRERPMYVC